MARAKCPVTRKDKFPDKMECELAISSIVSTSARHRKHKYRELPTHSYYCHSCRSYHMTSS